MLSVQNPPAVPQVYDYWQSLPQNVGRVIEPHNPRGSRMQMRYIEDDFSLSYRQPSEFGLDVEQLYWSPFNDETVLFDVFDRFSMSLSHSRRRPDELWFLNFTPDPPECTLACPSMNSALSLVFNDNVLEGTSQVPVFEDRVYRINPNEAFRTAQNVKYVPFPRFDRTYTWRDSRLVTVDANGNVTFTQLQNIWHSNTGNDDDSQTLNLDHSDWLKLVQTLTDADGDSDSASISIGQGVFKIEDDGPDASVDGRVAVPTLVLDETRPIGTDTDGDNDILIDELELSVRSYNCLKRAGIETIGQLLAKSESELAAIPNFGSKSIEEVIENLEGRGHHLRQD